MERTISIINKFNNLIKLEHHQHFLEFCKGVNVAPVGFRIKKIPSLVGTVSWKQHKDNFWHNCCSAWKRGPLAISGVYAEISLKKNFFMSRSRLS